MRTEHRTIKEERKRRREEAKKNFKNPYKVGDILEHSWGYDQTNTDFYQVVEAKKASVVLRPIANKTVEGSEGFMSKMVLPVKDSFLEKTTQALTDHRNDMVTPEKPTLFKRVSFYVQDNGEMVYYIPTPYGWCDLWNEKPSYDSSYA